jgi:glutaredoxin
MNKHVPEQATAGKDATKPATKQATLYRMVMDKHVCPWGQTSLYLLGKEGYAVDDRPLKTHAETEAFKADHGVKTTPQTFIGGQRVGG